MNKKDYKKIADGIKKLFVETLSTKPEIDLNINCYDVIKFCEKNKKLFKIELSQKEQKTDNEELKIVEKTNNLILGFVKGKDEDNEFIRMIFAINDDNKKIKSGQKLTELLAIIEKSVVFVDSISIGQVSNMPCLDMVKYLDEGKFRWI